MDYFSQKSAGGQEHCLPHISKKSIEVSPSRNVSRPFSWLGSGVRSWEVHDGNLPEVDWAVGRLFRQVETYVGHFLDLFLELEGDNYTMRIAATRSFRIYGLDCPNTNLRVVSIRFESRLIEVDRGRDSVWAISRHPEACRSSESHQHAGFLCFIQWYGSGGLAPENIFLGAEEGSMFADFFQKTLFEI